MKNAKVSINVETDGKIAQDTYTHTETHNHNASRYNGEWWMVNDGVQQNQTLNFAIVKRSHSFFYASFSFHVNCNAHELFLLE